MAKRISWGKLPIVLLTASAFLAYSFYSLTRYSQFLTAGYDLGIFDQAVRQYSHFSAPMVALKGAGYNLLGDHFHPIIAVLAPTYWVWDDPRVLLIAQSALVASSIPIVYAFIGDRVDRRLGLVLTFGYAFAWPFQGMVDFDFHEIAFAIPLLAWAIQCLEKGRRQGKGSDRGLVVCCLLLLCVREDMGAVVAMIGLIRALRPPRRWLGAALAGVGSIAFLVITMVVIPHINSTGKFGYWDYPDLGPNASAALGFMVTHPFRTVQLLFVPTVKAQTWAWLFLPVLLLPLASRYTLLAVPLLAQRFLSSRTNLWLTEFHYSAPIWVILFCGAIDAVARLSPGRRSLVAKAMAVVLAGSVVVGTGIDETQFPLRRLAGDAWGTTAHIRAQGRAVAMVPPGTCVAADDRLAPHLTRTNRTTLPGKPQPAADYVLLDLSQEKVGYDLESPQFYLAAYLASGYTVMSANGTTSGDGSASRDTQVTTDDQMVVLRRPGEIVATAGCGPAAP